MKYFIFLFICGVYKVKITSNLIFKKTLFCLRYDFRQIKKKKILL